MQKRTSIQHSAFSIPHSKRQSRCGMTLVELLIVIVIIGILISAVMVASTSLIGKSKTRNTQAVLQIVADAVEQFKRSETEKPTITRNAAYKKRYGLYPPDELEVFGNTPITGIPTGLATPARSVIVPAPPYENMKFYVDGDCSDSVCQSKEHRDLAALIVAIESQGGEAAAILDRISDRNRSVGVLDPNTKKPAQFLSRPEGINATSVDSEWNANNLQDDLQIRYILDDWGIPISYLSQRDFQEGKEDETRSKNYKDWNEASTELIRLNGGQPIIFSYGPNGKEQTSADLASTEEGAATFMGDFEPATPGPNNQPHVIDHPANSDNVYLHEGFREKLAKGIAE
jgi:prepilin-type N-terminal cleavage/methylation domain-containing protein